MKIKKKVKPKIEYPPPSNGAVANTILSVVLPQGKRVRWIFTHTQNGSYVSGYELI